MNEEHSLEQAIETIQAGDRLAGQRLLVAILKSNPKNEQAWLWLARTMPNDQQRITALEKCLSILPESEAARQALETLRAQRASGTGIPPAPPLIENQPQPETPAKIPPPAAQATPLSDRIAQVEAARSQAAGPEITREETRHPDIPAEPVQARPGLEETTSRMEPAVSPALRREGSSLQPRRAPKQRSGLSFIQWLILSLLVLVILVSAGWVILKTYQARQQELALQSAQATSAVLETQNAILTLQFSERQTQAALQATPTPTASPAATRTPRPTPTLTATPTPVPTQVGAVSRTGPENAASLVLQTALPGEFFTALSFSPDGALLAGASSTGITVWDSLTLEVLRYIFLENNAEAVTFSPDGSSIYFSQAGDSDRSMLFRAAASDFSMLLPGVELFNQTINLFVTPDDATLVLTSFTNTGNISLLDPVTGDKLTSLDHTGGLLAASLNARDGMLATAGYNDLIQIWDVAKRQTKTVLSAHSADVISLAFSPDGALLASASVDGVIKVWNCETWRLAATLQQHTQPVQALAFSPDHRLLVSADTDNQVLAWDTATASVVATFTGPAGLEDLAFSIDGAVLALAGEQAVEIWSLPGP